MFSICKVNYIRYALNLILLKIFTGIQDKSTISKAGTTDLIQNSVSYFQEFNIDPRFPMLERLMEMCWNKDATRRPSARDILTTNHMMSTDFLAQHKHFPRELEEVDYVTSVTEVN